MGKQLPGQSQHEGEDVPHQHVEALYGLWREVELKRLQRLGGGISQGSLGGNPGGMRMCPGCPRGHPQAATVGQVGTNLVRVKSDVAEEVSVNEENLLELVTF